MGKVLMIKTTTILNREEGRYPEGKETDTQKRRRQIPRREGDRYPEEKKADTQ